MILTAIVLGAIAVGLLAIGLARASGRDDYDQVMTNTWRNEHVRERRDDA